jgi:hypothetical protein
VPIEAVGLKLFTGIENFEIMAIPFSILAVNFLGVAKRMIDFATSMIGHGTAVSALGGMACAHFAAHGAYDRGVAVVDDHAGRSSSSSPTSRKSHCGYRGLSECYRGGERRARFAPDVRLSRAETVTNVEFSLTSRAPICRTTGLSIS